LKEICWNDAASGVTTWKCLACDNWKMVLIATWEMQKWHILVSSRNVSWSHRRSSLLLLGQTDRQTDIFI